MVKVNIKDVLGKKGKDIGWLENMSNKFGISPFDLRALCNKGGELKGGIIEFFTPDGKVQTTFGNIEKMCKVLECGISDILGSDEVPAKGDTVETPCKVGDTVYVLYKPTEYAKWDIIPMEVMGIEAFGSIRWVLNAEGKTEPVVWNMHAEGRETEAYKSFYDFGDSVFTTMKKAMEALDDKGICPGEVKEVKAYKTSDGELFPDERSAGRHEQEIAGIKTYFIKHMHGSRSGFVMIHAKRRHEMLLKQWLYCTYGNSILYTENMNSDTIKEAYGYEECDMVDVDENRILVRIEDECMEKIWA